MARVQRAREIHEGVDPPPGHRSICIDPEYIAADPSVDNRLSSCSLDEKVALNALRSTSEGHIDTASILNTTDAFPNVMFSSVDPQPRIIHSQVNGFVCFFNIERIMKRGRHFRWILFIVLYLI